MLPRSQLRIQTNEIIKKFSYIWVYPCLRCSNNNMSSSRTLTFTCDVLVNVKKKLTELDFWLHNLQVFYRFSFLIFILKKSSDTVICTVFLARMIQIL